MKLFPLCTFVYLCVLCGFGILNSLTTEDTKIHKGNHPTRFVSGYAFRHSANMKIDLVQPPRLTAALRRAFRLAKGEP